MDWEVPPLIVKRSMGAEVKRNCTTTRQATNLQGAPAQRNQTETRMKPSFKPSAKALAVPFRRDMEAQVFLGVRSICSYLHIGPSTFYTWGRHYDLPAMRTPDGRWMVSTVMIDD